MPLSACAACLTACLTVRLTLRRVLLLALLIFTALPSAWLPCLCALPWATRSLMKRLAARRATLMHPCNPSYRIISSCAAGRVYSIQPAPAPFRSLASCQAVPLNLSEGAHVGPAAPLHFTVALVGHIHTTARGRGARHARTQPANQTYLVGWMQSTRSSFRNPARCSALRSCTCACIGGSISAAGSCWVIQAGS